MSKPVYILGISAFYHDSAACLVKDGDILAAAQEERFTRKKHDAAFPQNAINFCLCQAGITTQDLSFVAYYEKPFLKFERILSTYLTYAPLGFKSFLQAMPVWMKDKLFLKEFLREKLNFSGEIVFTEHHESHAASAFFPSPFQEAAVLTMDGVGEWTTTSYGVGQGNCVELLGEIKFPHSLGLLYSAFTYYCGFRVNSGEYKLMGLAPYGEPLYTDIIRKELVDIKEDGSFRLNMKYFNYCAGLTMTNQRFNKLFDAPNRTPETKLSQKYMDVAASIQAVTEEIMLKMARHVHKETGKENLCLAGGVALNCVGNGKILKHGPFKKVWIQPAAGDAGGALGAAIFVWYQYLNNGRVGDNTHDLQKGSYLGPQINDDEVEKYLQSIQAPFEKLSDDQLITKVARLVNDEQVIGLVQSRMEFGPRALGARSIIGDARSEKMQEVLNLKIKFRESFRPFAPSVLSHRVNEYFDMHSESPYMLLVAPVQGKHLIAESANARQKGLGYLKIKRSHIPAVTHVDCSARVQTVHQNTNKIFYGIIDQFDKLTGCPVVINTSFNIRGEPIVCSPQDAYRCFMCTNMDYLVLGHFLLDKKKQPNQDKYKKEDISQELD